MPNQQFKRSQVARLEKRTDCYSNNSETNHLHDVAHIIHWIKDDFFPLLHFIQMEVALQPAVKKRIKPTLL